MEECMNIEILQADYLNQEHGKDIGYLMNCYSEDPMGGLDPQLKARDPLFK